jgi:hypothetical protein
LTKHTLARRLELEVADEADARALLSTMRLGATDMAAHYDLRWNQLLLMFVAGVPLTLALVVGWEGALAWLLPGIVPALFFGSMLRIGTDGVWVESIARKRFLPFEDVAEIVQENESIAVVLRSGARVTDRVLVGRRLRRGKRLKTSSAADAAALAERMNDALSAFRARPAEQDPSALLAPRGRNASQWRKDLRALFSAASYRAPVLPAEQLWRIAEDPAAEPAKRIGAAVVLRGALDDEGRARLRVAAEASAAPRVRVALLAASDTENDEALNAALEAFEDAASEPLERQKSTCDGS